MNTMITTTTNEHVSPDDNDYIQPQYSLWHILGIWAGAAIPMAILGWIAPPVLSPLPGQSPGFIKLYAMTVGLIWQGIFVLLIVRREEGTLTWDALRRRLWLRTPSDPKTNQPKPRLWWWVLPLLLLYGLENSPWSPGHFLDRLWVNALPFLAQPDIYNLDTLLSTSAGKASLVGAWWFLGLFFVQAIFNTVIGEELLFRGVLLPRMHGVFGKWDWVANGILFGLYHLHQPWMIPSGMLSGSLLFALPSRRFKCSWLGIITHSGQSVFLLFLFFGLVLGLA